jgi:fatty acid desaturase
MSKPHPRERRDVARDRFCRRLERLHLQFGYHVEHHLFPTVLPEPS